MKSVDLSNVSYIGADIVQALIEANSVKHKRDGVTFQAKDLTKDQLPKVDLVICRDCLVHLSYGDAFKALENISSSKSKYILTTNFYKTTKNRDIYTGQWRPLNLELPPFMLPPPIKVIDEGCTEQGGAFPDKTLALWEIGRIQERLKRHRA